VTAAVRYPFEGEIMGISTLSRGMKDRIADCPPM
jgi:hypothetical protein